MKLYAISNQYQPLVTVTLNPLPGSKLVCNKKVSISDLQTTFNNSTSNELITCNNEDNAIKVAMLLLKGNNTSPDLIEKGIVLFATPVIYEVDVDSGTLGDEEILNANHLNHYANTDIIPLYNLSSQLPDNIVLPDTIGEIAIRKLSELKLEAVTKASYFHSGGKKVVDVNFKSFSNTSTSSNNRIGSNTSMQMLGGFIAVMGIAAVATAFVALNAATFGIAGLAVAGLGMTAILGGIGLFSAGTYKKHQSIPDAVIQDSLIPTH